MKTILNTTLLAFSFFLLTISCNTATPDEFFQKTVLNSNILFEFGTDRMMEEIINAPADKEHYYSLILESKVMYLKKIIPDIEKTKAPDADGEELKTLSLDLYKTALAVFENEYLEIAKLNVENADKAVIEEKTKQIKEKYLEDFYTKYEALIVAGEAYAKKHNINASFK